MEKTMAEKTKGCALFQTISLIFLPLCLIGYAYSVYRGIDNKMTSYAMGVIFFSLLNADVVFKGEKTQNKVFDMLAKIEGIAVCVMVIVEVAVLLVR